MAISKLACLAASTAIYSSAALFAQTSIQVKPSPPIGQSGGPSGAVPVPSSGAGVSSSTNVSPGALTNSTVQTQNLPAPSGTAPSTFGGGPTNGPLGSLGGTVGAPGAGGTIGAIGGTSGTAGSAATNGALQQIGPNSGTSGRVQGSGAVTIPR